MWRDSLSDYVHIRVGHAILCTFTCDSPSWLNVTDRLSTFTNAQRQQELGVYRIPVEFLHTPGSGKFSLLHMSPNRACSEEANVTEGGVYIEQVPFESMLEMRGAGSMLQIRQNSLFDSNTGVIKVTGLAKQIQTYCRW